MSGIPLTRLQSATALKPLLLQVAPLRPVSNQTGPPVLVLLPASGGRVVALADRRGEKGKEGLARAAAAAVVSAAAAGDPAGGAARRARAAGASAAGADSSVSVAGRGGQPVQGMSVQLATVHVSLFNDLEI